MTDTHSDVTEDTKATGVQDPQLDHGNTGEPAPSNKDRAAANEAADKEAKAKADGAPEDETPDDDKELMFELPRFAVLRQIRR